MIPAWALPRMTIRPWMERRTAHPPGIGPLTPEEWLQTDATYGAQMALRDELALTSPDKVIACLPEAEAAAQELLGALTAELTARHGARIDGAALIRADGVRVPLDGPPMAAICRLAQEDFLILQRPVDAAEHVLTAGALCFPSNWVLTEKIGKALLRIHLPVREYEGPLASRVQRLHDGVAAGRPLIRANWNFALIPDLFTPTPEAEKMARRESRAAPADWRGGWIRVERQCLSRLPVTGAVVFAVRTLIAPLTGCTDEDWAGFHRAIAELPEEIRASKAGPAIVAEAARRAGA